MADNTELVTRIKLFQAGLAKSKSETVLNHVRIGKALAELKAVTKTTTRWRNQLAEVSLSRRVADRYLQLGESWWTEALLEAEGLLHQLPADLEKLEWLCRLPQASLKANVDMIGDLPRETLIRKVQQKLGIQPPKKAADPVTAKTFRQKCELLMDQLIDLATEAGPEIGDDAARKAIVDDLMIRIEKIEKALMDEGQGSTEEQAAPAVTA